MKTYILILLFVIPSFVIHGQKKLFLEVENTKEQNITFSNISSAFVEANKVTQEAYLYTHFIKPEEVRIFEYVPSRTVSINSAISWQLLIENKDIELELIEVPTSFYEYEVVTSNGERYAANTNIKHYRGVIKGDSTSVVAMTFNGNEVQGIISNNDGNYNIGLDTQLGKHILYNDKNIKSVSGFNCGTVDDYNEIYDPTILLQEFRATNVVNYYKYVRFFLETEYDIFQSKGSVSNVEGFLIGLFNQVAAIYQNEGIQICLSEIYVWNTVDPYVGTTTTDLLTEFQNRKTSINGDLGQLLTYRSIGGGKAAGFNGLHSSNVNDKLSVAGIESFYSSFPTYSWSIFAMAHEFGHLFGSRHTHTCVWNGNNSAIDGCESVEGSCATPGIPANGGTIMSYCHLQDVGINFNLGFVLSRETW